MLLLLGDQLIRDAGIAVFELVKNAYDADSPDVTVTMSRVDDRKTGSIVVEDSGTGMDHDTVTNVWLEPGTDYRGEQRRRGKRTPKFGRLPLGEKGVGRFASHKLGTHVKLVTRKANSPEVVVEIDWERDFGKKRYLADVEVIVSERRPEYFTGRKAGTRIEITDLRASWNRGMVRELARAMNSICAPFGAKGDFHTELVLVDNKEWLEGILDVRNLLKYALFKASCDVVGDKLSYSYSFVPFPAMRDKVQPRTMKRDGKKALNISSPQGPVNLNDHNIGPVHIDLYIFDRQPRSLHLGNIKDKKGLKDYLDVSGGIRVYRDGIRVYDYGEPGNDWLDLGSKRINTPGERISNNLIIGAVSLNLKSGVDPDKGIGLIEKTNREGFVDNPDFRAFRDAVQFAITEIETERNVDKTRIRNAYSTAALKEPVIEDITELRQIATRRKLTKEIGPYLDRIERDYVLIRDRFLTSASAGLSLSVVIHEVEKGVQELAKAVLREKSSTRLKALAKHLADLIEGFAALAQRSGAGKTKASALISQALFNTNLRLEDHGITSIVNLNQGDFQAQCPRRLVISTLMNLIDNSIWWLDNKWGRGETKNKKRLYLGTSKELAGGPAIVVADNGPGFIDPPEYLIEPFISRKPHGMGLGLHIADEVMKSQGGRLVFPQVGDVTLPKEFTGATVALVFGGKKK
jgi:signal transduction histidine kinase